MSKPEQHTFDDVSREVIGAALEVHRTLGPHFEELTYQLALAQEFRRRGLDYGREVHVPIYYKGRKLHARRVDFVVAECMVEIKAKAVLEPKDFEQTLSYLKASDYKVALLLNFGAKKLEIKRIVN
ncbi:MAG: hypothetical protein A3F84_09265 [Candidatus Handelsmanbacteria bacterium RIFCSPLOWO2_12_FULL_64_10]|uniref:GxxExxY protein n=1 Tax=Handelsmanbacteria sp. (strain RIFCSPLOWO2_12_FULL_64_10) TaxID=1817868 RepID=A0A1F6CZ47_HANXR|nr:MAG: hypothetical protein A3F84_09265 [Candidatus Handelsmanbacteria bacterium RIFCSPLOWO2_12_FULL_64_10]